MARRRIEVISSDLTGKEIPDVDQVAELRVLDHPQLDHPVRLDAFVLEVAGLKQTVKELVTVEVVLPGEAPERVVLELVDFDKLITNGAVDDVLLSAQRYNPAGEPIGKGRGRRPGRKDAPSETPSTKRDPEQLRSIREWARQNGWPDLGNRGRIPAAADEAYQAAH